MLLLPLALAADPPVLLDRGVVLASDPAWPWGFGAVTVAWDGAGYTLFFESQVAAPEGSSCPYRYVIGRATSPDGLTWAVDPDPVLAGEPDDPESPTYCGVSQPGVAFDGTTWHLAYMQDEGPFPAGGQGLRAESVGYAQGVDGRSFTVLEEDVGVLTADESCGDDGWSPAGYPSVVVVNDEVYVFYQAAGGDLGYARSGADRGLARAHYALAREYAYEESGWGFLPSAVCDDSASSTFRLLYLTLGRGEGWAAGPAPWVADGASVEVDLAGFPDPGIVRHADLLRAGGDAYLLWYTAIDAEERRVVGLASTAGVTDPALADARLRACTIPDGGEPPDDVPPPPDTGAATWPPARSVSEPRSDADTGCPPEGDTAAATADPEPSIAGWTCGGCAAGGLPTGGWRASMVGLLLLLGATLGRRTGGAGRATPGR